MTITQIIRAKKETEKRKAPKTSRAEYMAGMTASITAPPTNSFSNRQDIGIAMSEKDIMPKYVSRPFLHFSASTSFN